MGSAILVLIIMLAAAGSVVWSSVRNGISPMPTSRKVKRRFLNTLPEQVGGTILELGAGWGSLAFPIARRYPDSMVIAYESSWIPYLYCRLRQLWQPLPNLRIVCDDFYNVPFNGASLVVCYLYPGAMNRLKDKFLKELPPGAAVATHTFALPDWPPDHTETINDLYHTKIYHYINK